MNLPLAALQTPDDVDAPLRLLHARRREPYRDLGPAHFDQRLRIRTASRLLKRLKEMGIDVLQTRVSARNRASYSLGGFLQRLVRRGLAHFADQPQLARTVWRALVACPLGRPVPEAQAAAIDHEYHRCELDGQDHDFHSASSVRDGIMVVRTVSLL
jgi:hypothetical protein